MLGKRLEEANRRAEKRWKYFHLETWNLYQKFIDRTGILTSNETRYGMGMTHFPVIGTYRKRKGCECRGCSNNKQREKRERVLKLRRENIPV